MPKTVAVGFRLGPILRGYLSDDGAALCAATEAVTWLREMLGGWSRAAVGHGSLCFQPADDASRQRNGSDNQHGAEYAPIGLLLEMQA
jgi:hypothetical protein